MKHLRKTVIAVILLLGALAGCGRQALPEVTIPHETTEKQPTLSHEQATTTPPVTEPPATEPPVTEPTVTEPTVTEPPVTEPPVTEPTVTEPPVTESPVTEPPVTEPPHVHAYAATVKAPTCTEGGYTTYTCACGDSYRGEETPATGHQYKEIIVPPKVGKEGHTSHECPCGKIYWDNYTTLSEEEMAAIEQELSNLIIKELNRRRAEQNAPSLESQPIMSLVAQYRSRQLLTHYGHHTMDIREAHAAYQYGIYVDMTEYGYPESYNYYYSNSSEAIGWIGITDGLQEQAENVVRAFYMSEDHWSYLGDAKNIYCAVGCSANNSDWMICIMVNNITYG